VLEIWRAYIRTYVVSETIPFVGRRLVSLLHQAGAVPRRTPGSSSVAARPAGFADLVENLAGILVGAREAILQAGRLDDRPFEDALAALRGGAPVPTPLCGSRLLGRGSPAA